MKYKVTSNYNPSVNVYYDLMQAKLSTLDVSLGVPENTVMYITEYSSDDKPTGFWFRVTRGKMVANIIR